MKRKLFGKILDVGCGNNKFPNSIGMDKIKLATVDCVHDMNCFPWPFKENEFNSVLLNTAILLLKRWKKSIASWLQEGLCISQPHIIQMPLVGRM